MSAVLENMIKISMQPSINDADCPLIKKAYEYACDLPEGEERSDLLFIITKKLWVMPFAA